MAESVGSGGNLTIDRHLRREAVSGSRTRDRASRRRRDRGEIEVRHRRCGERRGKGVEENRGQASILSGAMSGDCRRSIAAGTLPERVRGIEPPRHPTSSGRTASPVAPAAPPPRGPGSVGAFTLVASRSGYGSFDRGCPDRDGAIAAKRHRSLALRCMRQRTALTGVRDRSRGRSATEGTDRRGHGRPVAAGSMRRNAVGDSALFGRLVSIAR